MTSLSDADINMQENEFSSRGNVIADDDFVDVSLETNDGSRDTNMESDVFRRGRWRKPFSYFKGVFSNNYSIPTDRIVSMVMTDHALQNEYDNGFSVDRCMTYHASTAYSTEVAGLVDGGANGGLANPKEMRLISYCYPPRYVNITGVGDLNIPRLKIGIYAAKVQLSDGNYVLMMFHEYGELQNGKTIHSKIQLADNGCVIHDHPELLGGAQCLTTLEGHQVPLDFENGLPYIKMQYPDDDDLLLPSVSMTRDIPWDPSRYDTNKSSKVLDFDQQESPYLSIPVHPNANQYGEFITTNYGELDLEDPIEDLLMVARGYQRRVVSTGELLPLPTDPIHCAYEMAFPVEVYSNVYECYSTLGNLNNHVAQQRLDPIQYQEYRKYFLNVPASTVRSTFDSTTQYYRFIPTTNKFMTYRSPYPALNVFRRHEIVFTDRRSHSAIEKTVPLYRSRSLLVS